MTRSGGAQTEDVWSSNPRKAARRGRLVRWLPPLLTAVIRIVHATLRYRLDVAPDTRRLFRSSHPFILAFWHGRMVILSQIFRTQFRPPADLYVVISQHWDGEIIARTVRPFGVHGIRGSSTRGGREAFAQGVERIRAGDRVGITPDGPSGPRYRVVQTGILRLARETGAPIVPVCWSAQPRVVMGSWDRFQIPLPWARVHVQYGDPLFLDAQESLETQRTRVETRMNHLNHETAARAIDASTGACSVAGYRVYRGLLGALRVPRLLRKRGKGRPAEPGTPAPPPPEWHGGTWARGEEPVWVHMASGAEVPAVLALAESLRSGTPRETIVISSATRRDLETVRKPLREGARALSLCEGRPPCAKGLRRIHPRILLLAGNAIRPDLLLLLGRMGISVGVAYGRVSCAECRRSLRFRSFFRVVLSHVCVFGMMSRVDAQRIILMGADPRRVHVTGGRGDRERAFSGFHGESPVSRQPAGRVSPEEVGVWRAAAERNRALFRPWLDHE